MDLGGWLRQLGLEHYEAAFRENKIDDTVLPSLTVEDLKDLGVGLVGDRRKLLNAIAALRGEAATAAPLSGTPLEADKAAKDTAERRQVTVMFSDLVGSTALSARTDPEDLREVISAYQRCVAKTVRRFGGFVARYLGDGVLIYFGYPAAHEDDAERAVRAGLALIDAVAALPAPEPQQVRIGVATGMVVVGDLLGSGEAQEHDIVGETPNLAARLQGIAEPNTVVIAEATRRLIGNLFELRDLGPKDLKGIAGPLKAFAVLGASSVESRFEAMHPEVLTALVGREEELELLSRRWAKAKTGEGQWCCCAVRPASANPGLPPRSWRTSRPSHTRGCVISARHSRPTALFIRSSGSSNVLPDLHTATPRKQSSTSLMRYWRRPRRPGRMRRSSPSCCHFLTTDATPLWSLLPNSAGRRRLQHLTCNWKPWRAPAPC